MKIILVKYHMEEIIIDLKSKFSSDKLLELLQCIEKLTSESSIVNHKQIEKKRLTLSARLNELNRKILAGVISHNDSQISKNKIRAGIWDLIRVLEKINTINQQRQIRQQNEFTETTNFLDLNLIEHNQFLDDRDGQIYKTLEIRGKIWMVENFNYDVGKGCWMYKNKTKYGNIYGRLYTWEAANKACPTGWHIPTDKEWKELVMNFGGYSKGIFLKNIGKPKKAFKSLKYGGDSGFSALFGGDRGGDGCFSSLKKTGYYWSDNKCYYSFNSVGNKMVQRHKQFSKKRAFSCRYIG